MASAAALTGIQINGLQWRAKLPIKAFIPDDCTAIGDEHAATAGKIIAKHLAKHEFAIGLIISDISFTFSDFEFEYVRSQQDLMNALNDLYNWADYERIVIQ